ncbi:uncharacterized protein N7515_007300 [Penicillium bovifimosum]|uniref:Swi5-dependent recombination DNA repair protein 1 n=1 Tax=Penicillium bovifimosum TaxID=126998 RepID=A0A9W9GXN8_9EURO|nr:uncharacterized protein N7515_007300 [Penicillium bovifimosum]KAJ5131261.1 hypothetical protein N7515_007300 [Penicillium bovifimosum]
MSHQPSKRRRTDAAAALSKPFKSPLRRPVPTSTNDLPSTPVASKTPIGTQVSATPTTPREPQLDPNPPHPATPVPSQRKRSRYSLETPLAPPDPEVLELQKQQRALQSQVDALRAKLETANQALKLESSTKTTELQTLISKWRLVSQDAADEVFVGAKERVSGMGGLTAWKARSKADASRWDFDGERHEREHADDDEAGYDYAESSEGLQDEKDDAEQGAEGGQDEVG